MPRWLVIVALLAGCDDIVPAEVDAGPDAAPRGQGSEASSDLVINEVAPRGEGPDWIELYNRGDAAIDLCGFFLTNAVDRLDNYLPLGGVMPPAPCAPLLLEAGARRLIYLDGTDLADPIDPTHAPFKLGVADEIHVVAIDGLVVDGLLFLYPPGPEAPADVTLSRDPDGAGLFFERGPTPGEPNPSELP